ncbi:MAG: hypothetical protein Q6370_025510, partial [Candidatus Sigynarchaeota archaeon]
MQNRSELLTDQHKRLALLIVAMLDGQEHYLSELVNIIIGRKKTLITFFSDSSETRDYIKKLFNTFSTKDDAE